MLLACILFSPFILGNKFVRSLKSISKAMQARREAYLWHLWEETNRVSQVQIPSVAVSGPPNPIYVDINNQTGLASDANTGADTSHPILTIPGMTDKTDTTALSGSWCNGTITSSGLNVPDGTTFILMGGTICTSNQCGRIHINASSVSGALSGYPCYYTKTPTTGAGITIQRATNWGVGPVVFDFKNCAIRNLSAPGSFFCAAMRLNLDGVSGFTTRNYANMQGGFNSWISDGIVVSNSIDVPYFAYAYSVAQGGSLYFPGPSFRANYFFNNGTGLTSPTNNEVRYTYVITGDSSQFFTWGNPTWTNCDVNPNGNYQGGIRLGEQVGRATNVIANYVVIHDAGHQFEGDSTKACRGFVFKTTTGTLINCMAFNMLKGADISNPLNGSPASVPVGWYGGFTNIGFISYSNVLMGNGFNGCWGVSGGANKYTNDAIGWLINCIFVDNGSTNLHSPGFKAYGGPSHVYAIGCTFARNQDNVLANPSGDLSDGGGPDTNVYVVTLYNNIFHKPYPFDGNVNNAYFGTWASNFVWTADYNAYTATNPANASEPFYQSSAYTGAGGEYVPATFLYGVNGPGHSSGSWYTYNSWNDDAHSIGTGSAVSTASPPFVSEYGTINLGISSSYGPGTNLSSMPWYRAEMGVDINGKSRGGTPDMGAFQFGTDPNITVQPTSQTAQVGNPATFSVTATGNTTLSYQWNWFGTNVAGATASTWTTPATTPGMSGSSVYVTVSDVAGPLQSVTVMLTVLYGGGVMIR